MLTGKDGERRRDLRGIAIGPLSPHRVARDPGTLGEGLGGDAPVLARELPPRQRGPDNQAPARLRQKPRAVVLQASIENIVGGLLTDGGDTVVDLGASENGGTVVGSLLAVEGVGSVVGPLMVGFITDTLSPRAGMGAIGVIFATLVAVTLAGNRAGVSADQAVAHVDT